jgi:L-cysteine S-thiosulfotransferase
MATALAGDAAPGVTTSGEVAPGAMLGDAARGAMLGEAARGAMLGDAARGAAVAVSRTQGLCVLCHAVPGVNPVHAGTLGPSLAGVGARLSADELRQRLVAPERFNARTVMPSYARVEGLERVAAARRGQPVLDAQQIEDVLVWLQTLK